MSKKDHVEKTVGPWAKQKLDALEMYLESYMQVMKHQPFTLFYIDAFAGAGIVKVRDSGSTADADPLQQLLPEDLTVTDQEQVEEYIKGSPLRALGLSKRFNHYRFVDIDPRRAKDLQELAAPYSDCDLKVRTGDANAIVQDIASKFTGRLWRGVAFLDPYGPHLHWQTLVALAETGKFDVIINFPMGMAINRLIKRDGNIPESWKSQLDSCFGCSDWKDIAFGTTNSFFGELSFKHDDAGERLLELYVTRLKEIFASVAPPSLVRSPTNHPLYYLIWASSNARGLPIAQHILKLGEKTALATKRRRR